MICNNHNQVVIRKKDGDRRTIIRCADVGSPYFTKEVTDDQCGQCPRHLEAVEAAARLTAKCSSRDSEPVPTTPSLARRSLTYAEAVAGWVKSGRPERTDEETQRIFTDHCSKCGWYDRDQQICRGCGCKVSGIGHAIFNKIKMGTQHCPRKLW